MRDPNSQNTAKQAPSEEELYAQELGKAYLELCGRGLFVGELDERRFRGWFQGGIAIDTAKRGMSLAFEAFRQKNKGSLLWRTPPVSFCEALVKKEHNKLKAATKVVGATPPPPPDPAVDERRRALCERLAEEGKIEQDPLVREAYRRAYRRLLRLQPSPETAEKVRRIDEILCDEVYHLLGEKVRAEIDEQVQTALSRSSAAADKEALHELAHATRRRELRRRLQLFRLEL